MDIFFNTNSRFESLYGRKSNPFFVAQKKKDGPTYGKRITKRGQQYKLGLDSTGIVYGKNKTFKTRISIPRQISLIINIHIHHTSSRRATVFYIGEVTALSAIHI
jgi:hypothetical protein